MNPTAELLIQLAVVVLATAPVLAITWRLGDSEVDA